MVWKNVVKWTDETIESEIKKVMKTLCIDRMPSVSEIIMINNNAQLTNAIRRHGGYKHWSEKLGLNMKESETKIGWKGEEYATELLLKRGYKVEKMPTKYPYDLLVDDAVKIDVKTSNRFYYTKKNYYYTFNLEKKNSTCDLYLFVCIQNDFKIDKNLIIPGKALKQTQLSISDNSRLDSYIDRWDYIKSFSEFFKSI